MNVSEEMMDVLRQAAIRGNGEASNSADTVPLPYVNLALDLTPREWLVPGRIPMRNVSSMSGEGAIGKSLLLMQLSGAVALGKDWIGTLPEQGPVLYFNAEEDDDEVRRRMEDVARHLGATRQDMIDNGLLFLSFAGRDAILAQPDRSGILRPTPLFDRLRSEALQLRPKLIVFDTVADTFGGKENDRGQTRQFITMLRGLALSTAGRIKVQTEGPPSHPRTRLVEASTDPSTDLPPPSTEVCVPSPHTPHRPVERAWGGGSPARSNRPGKWKSDDLPYDGPSR